MAAKVASYVKNVGKSIAYSSIDVLKENAEGLTNFLEESNNLAKGAYATIKNLKKGKKDGAEENKIVSAVNAGVKNLIKSIKTGDFYNKALDDEHIKDMFGEDFLDFDSGFDDGGDFEFSSGSGSKSEASELADSMESAIGAAATVNATAVAQSTDMIIKSGRASNKAVISQMEIMNTSITSNIGALYNQMNQANEFLKGPMTAHLNNSKTYYENMTRMMQEQTAMMKEMIDTNRRIYGDGKSKSNRSERLQQSINSDGSLNIDGYLKNIKSNIDDSMFGMVLGMLGGFGGGDSGGGGGGIKTMITSLQRMGLNLLTGKLMGKDFQKSLNNFDKGLSSLFSNFIVRMNSKKNDFSNGFLQTLAEFLGVNIKKKDNINTGNYNKGPVPFDGTTRKAIIEVIPGYLSRIEAALTGRGRKSEKYFDYAAGKWTTVEQAEENLEKEKLRAINSASYDVKDDLRPLIDELRSKNEKDAKEFEKFLNKMLTKIFEDGGDFRPQITDMKTRTSGGDAWKRYGARNKAEFDMALKYMSNNTIRRMAYSNMNARQDLSNRMQEFENDGSSIYNILFNEQLGDIKTDDETWKKYGARSKAEFDLALKHILNNSASDMGVKRSKYMQKLIERIERDESVFDKVFNKEGDHTISGISKSGGTGILAASRDETGKNIFYYLREILKKIDSSHNSRPEENQKVKNNRARSSRTSTDNTASEEMPSDSDDDPDEEEDEDARLAEMMAMIEEEDRKKKEEDLKRNPNVLKKWIREKFGDTRLGKWISSKTSNESNSLFKGPFKYMSELLDKADNAIFKMVFGENEYKDDEGNPIHSVLDYMMYKVKRSFEDLTNWMKEKIFNPLEDKIKKFFNEKIKPKYEKYVKPTIDQAGEYIKSGWKRTKKAVPDTIDSIDDMLNNGGIISADEAENAALDNYWEAKAKEAGYRSTAQARRNTTRGKNAADDILESARGRLVTKRGLTMISPGEVIIPATFDKKEQNKQLALEKRDKSRITKALKFGNIEYNAQGSISKEDLDTIIKEIKTTTKYKVPEIGAGGLIGGGAGLIAGLNPILGAVLGSAISFVNQSAATKDILFGKQNKEGKRTGDGVIPKKVLQVFDKYGKDIFDFGIAGGIAGLVSPLGIVGTAAVGAGVGFLKNNESFKKFVFGDLEHGKDGLISKESLNKVKKIFKKNLPRMVTGAGIGAGIGAIVGGPFGILGNAALGAGASLLSTSNFFHELMFGDGTEGNTGIAGAFKEGIIDPFKAKLKETVTGLGDFLKKQVATPFEAFVKAITQDIKNVLTSVGDGIKDTIHNIFTSYIGVPIRDFLLQKLFKPITKTVGFLLKGPTALAKAAVSLPFKALGAVAEHRRTRQIAKGKALDMSAQERLDFRNKNKKSKFKFGVMRGLGTDQTLQQDEYLAGLSQDELMALSETVSGNIESKDAIEKEQSDASAAIKNHISEYFRRTDDDGKNLYDKITYKKSKEIYNAAKVGNVKEFDRLLKSSGLSKEQQEELKSGLQDKFAAYDKARNRMNAANMSDEERDDRLSKILGHEIKGRKDQRTLKRVLDAEVKARIRQDAKANIDLNAEEEQKDPVQKATEESGDKIKNAIETKSDELLEVLRKNNEYLKSLITGDTSFLDAEERAAAEEAQAKADIESGKFDTNDSIKDAMNEVKDVPEEPEEQETPKIKSKLPKNFNPNLDINKMGRKQKKKYKKLLGIYEEEQAAANEDSKEYKEGKAEKDEAARGEEEELAHTKATSENMAAVAEELTGSSTDAKGKKKKKKEKDPNKGGFLGTLGTGLGTLLKYLGIGGSFVGKLALGIGGISLAGYASEWLQTSVWPATKKLLFGTENTESGQYEGGLVPSLGNFLLGNKVTGEKGVVGKITDWFGEKFTAFGNWITNDFPTFFSEKLLPVVINGIGLAAENIVVPLTEALLVATPKIVAGVVKGVWNYITGKNADGGDVGDGDSGIDASTAKEYGLNVNSEGQIVTPDGTVVKTGGFATEDETTANKLTGAVGRSFLKAAGGVGTGKSKLATKLSKIKINGFKKVPTNVVSATIGATSTAARAGIKGTAGAVNASGTLGGFVADKINAFGDKVRNAARQAQGKELIDTEALIQDRLEANDMLNQKMYDESIIGKFKKGFNSRKEAALKKIAGESAENVVEEGAESILEGAANAGNKKLTLGGAIKKRLANTKAGQFVGDTVAGVKNAFGNTKVGGAVKKVTNFTKGLKEGATNKLASIGKGISSAIGGVKDKVVDKFGKKVVKEAAEEGGEKALKSGMTSFFEKLAKGKVGDKICSLIGGESMRSKLVKAFSDMAEKLSKRFITKGGAKICTKIAGLIAKFNPIGLAMLIVDFLEGFNNAHTILGVAKEKDGYQVDFGQKCVCGLLNLITANLTLGLVDPGDIVDILMEYIFPLFGLDTEELTNARAEADNVLAKWNAEHPEEQYETLEEYNKKDTWTTKVKNKVKSIWNGFFGKGKDEKDSGKGSNKSLVQQEYDKKVANEYTGKGRHNYQKNSAISNIRYGDSTIGESGCAPVAASNVINRIRGGYSSVADAASYAERNNMTVPGGGTDINYFNHYFNSQGIPNYSTSNRNDVMNAIKNGNQVVMLGKDSSNTKNAPFGTNPHFITAVGTNRNGDIIAEDPDLPQSTVTYKKNKVLGSMIRSVVTGKSRGSRGGRRSGRGRSGFVGGARNLGPQGIINIAYSQLGKMSTIDNQVIYNDVFYGYHAYGKNYGWCCVFVWWCFNQAGASHLLPVKTGRCADLMSAFAAKGQLVDKPQAGDIAFMNFDGASHAAHVGIVLGVDTNGKVMTIDGNTTVGSDNPPYGVAQKTRSMSYFVGFARPNYPYEYDADSVVDMTEYGDYSDYYSMAHNLTTGSATEAIDSVSVPETAASTGTTQVVNSGNINRGTTASGVPIMSTNVSSYKVKSAANQDTSTTEDKYAKYSSIGDIFSLFTELGTNIFKAWIGEDKYNALFNSNSSSEDEAAGSNAAVGEHFEEDGVIYYYDENGTKCRAGYAQNKDSASSSSSSQETTTNTGTPAGETDIYSTTTSTRFTQKDLDKIYDNAMAKKNAASTGTDSVASATTSSAATAPTSTASTASSGNMASAKSSISSSHSLTGSDNAKHIWNTLSKKGVYTKAGLAGLMGNLEQESGYKAANVENTFESSYGDDATYTKRVDDGTYTRDDFINGHKFGYGLPGWTWWSLKEGLYDHTVGQKKSLGDLDAQIDFLHKNISEQYPGLYKTLTTTNDVNEATDAMLEQYERPYGFSYNNNDSSQGYSSHPDHVAARTREYNTRRTNAQRVYSTYAGEGRKPGINVANALRSGGVRTENAGLATNSITTVDPAVEVKEVNYNQSPMNTSSVINYTTFLETIVEVLLSIADNTAMLNQIISILSENFDIKVDASDVSSARTQARDKAKQSLNELIQRTNGNNMHASNLLENRDTQSILSQMVMLARE